MITQPLRIATRGAQITLRATREAVGIAEDVVGLVAAKLVGRNGHHNGDGGAEPAVWEGPAASSTSSPADRPATAAEPPVATAEPPATPVEPADRPATAAEPPVPTAEPPVATAEPPATPVEPAAIPVEPPAPPAPPPTTVAEEMAALFPETGHVSEEPELIEEVAEPGAEEGAGADVHIAEPWDGYRTMKAADIIDRLGTASREELAAVELYELAGRNRKSVVAAAQQALKRSSPPRP